MCMRNLGGVCEGILHLHRIMAGSGVAQITTASTCSRSKMTSGCYQLRGFFNGVDCRPIDFNERLPPPRVCSLCGVVPSKIAAMPCGHVLCECCIAGCTDGGRLTCPFDKEQFESKEDICWVFPSRSHLAKMQVSCWNAKRGCDFVGPAGELLDHFEKNCSFHAVACPRCAEAILCRDLPKHYMAVCAAADSTTSQEPTAMDSSEGDVSAREDPDAVACHDILTSIQSRVNQLAEATAALDTRLAQPLQSTELTVENAKGFDLPACISIGLTAAAVVLLILLCCYSFTRPKPMCPVGGMLSSEDRSWISGEIRLALEPKPVHPIIVAQDACPALKVSVEKGNPE